MTGYKLTNATLRAHDSPSFGTPSAKEISKIKPGNLVKLIFEHPRGSERMWVNVVSVTHGEFVGEVDNAAINPSLPKLGEKITFYADNIINILE
jgi:hypothetical protein